MTTKLQIDAGRSGKFSTGVLTRALDPETGKIRSADISELTATSLDDWLSDGRKESDTHAQLVVKTLLGHGGPPRSPQTSSLDRKRDLAVARVRNKLIARANDGDALVAELASEAMKYVLDILAVLDEPYHPAGASMVALLVTENAGRTKTGRQMWAKYRNEDSPRAVAEFRKKLQDRSGKDS